MNINYRQPQFELFPKDVPGHDDVNKPKLLLANLTLSMESLVILTILGIMLALFSFSLGVERGKHLAAQALDERVSAAWNLAPRKPALPAKQSAQVQQAAGTQRMASRNRVLVPAPMPVVTTPTRPSTPVKSVAGSQRFTVQVATYKNEAFARQEALGLKAKGLGTFLIKKGDFWLVCLGQFATQESALAVMKKVQPKYHGSTVRRF